MPKLPTITFTSFTDDGDEVEHQLPAKYEVCRQCDGTGTTVAHVECDGGGFTSSEWAEQDDDFREGYLSGAYDRPCPCCKGLRVVSVVDEKACAPDLLAAYQEEQREEADYQRMCEAERRYGC